MKTPSRKLTTPALCQDPQCNNASEPIEAGAWVYLIKGRWTCDGCLEEIRDAEKESRANYLDERGL